MSGMIEVAQATVTIIPTMQGSQAAITKDLTAELAPAGTAAGAAAGKNVASSMSSTLSKAGATLTKGVTLPIAAIGAASIAAFNEVDGGLDIITTKTGASGDALEEMGGIMKNIATSIPTDFETAGSAVGEVNTRFGLTGKALEDLSTRFVKFSKLNKTDVSTSVDNVSKVLAAFGLDADHAGTMLDALNTVGQQTGVDLTTLSTQLSQNAAQFQQMGLSAEDAASFLGQCDMAGLETSTMLMGLKTAMKNAANDGKTLDEFLADFSTTMSSNASESDKLAAAYEAFGTRAGGAIYNAVSTGKLDLQNFTTSLGDFEGSVNETFENMVDPSEQFTQVINELKILGADIAEAVMPAIKDIVETAVPIIKDLVDKWNALPPGMQQFIIKGAMVVAAIGPIMSAGSGLIGTIGKIKGAFSGLSTSMSDMSGKFGGIASVMKTDVSDLSSTVSGKLGVAAGAAGTFFAAFTFTDWILEITGAKEALEDFGGQIYDFFHQAEQASVDMTNSAMAAFEAFALRGEGTFEDVMSKLLEAQEAASAANTEITNQDAETLQKYIDLMESGVAEARAKEAQSRQLANEALVADNQMTAETLQATMDAAQSYIETGAGNAQTIMTNLQTAYDQYAAKTDITSQTTAANIQGMMTSMTEAMGVTSATMATTAEEAATNLQTALADAASYLESGRGDTEAILTNLQAAYQTYSQYVDDSSGEVATSVNDMVSAVEQASGVSTSATETMQADTVADLAAISQAMSSLGITDVGQFVSAIETGLSSVDTAFGAMQTSISDNMGKASQAVASAISEIQGQFANTTFSFNQGIALPHFYMSGSFNAETGQVPTVGVSWYARAAEEGALFADPTIIGVGDAAQPEMLIGEQTLYEQIARAMKEAAPEGGDIIIPVYLGGDLIDTLVVRANQRHNYRSGGRS